MRNKQERVTITKKDLAEVLQELLKENVVGIVQNEGANGFEYVFPGGKAFRVCVEEICKK